MKLNLAYFKYDPVTQTVEVDQEKESLRMIKVPKSTTKVCCESNSFRLVVNKDKTAYITGAKGDTFDINEKVDIPLEYIDHFAI